MNVYEFSMNIKEWWKDEDEDKELGVGGSLLYTMDMQSNGWNHIKILNIKKLTEITKRGNDRKYKGPNWNIL